MKGSVSGSQFHTRELTPPPAAEPASQSPPLRKLEGVRRALIDATPSGELQDQRAILARSVVDVQAALAGDADAIDCVRFMELQLSIGEIQDAKAASAVFNRLLGHGAVLARHDQHGVMQFLARELAAGLVATARPATPQARGALCEALLKAAHLAYTQEGADAAVIESIVTGLAQGICAREVPGDVKSERDGEAPPTRWQDRGLTGQDAEAVLDHLASRSALGDRRLQRAFSDGLVARPPDAQPASNSTKRVRDEKVEATRSQPAQPRLPPADAPPRTTSQALALIDTAALAGDSDRVIAQVATLMAAGGIASPADRTRVFQALARKFGDSCLDNELPTALLRAAATPGVKDDPACIGLALMARKKLDASAVDRYLHAALPQGEQDVPDPVQLQQRLRLLGEMLGARGRARSRDGYEALAHLNFSEAILRSNPYLDADVRIQANLQLLEGFEDKDVRSQAGLLESVRRSANQAAATPPRQVPPGLEASIAMAGDPIVDPESGARQLVDAVLAAAQDRRPAVADALARGLVATFGQQEAIDALLSASAQALATRPVADDEGRHCMAELAWTLLAFPDAGQPVKPEAINRLVGASVEALAGQGLMVGGGPRLVLAMQALRTCAPRSALIDQSPHWAAAVGGSLPGHLRESSLATLRPSLSRLESAAQTLRRATHRNGFQGLRHSLAAPKALHSKIATAASAVAALRHFISEGPAIRKRSPQEFEAHRTHLVERVAGMQDSEVAAAVNHLRMGLTPDQRKLLGEGVVNELIEKFESVFHPTVTPPASDVRVPATTGAIMVDGKHTPTHTKPTLDPLANDVTDLAAEIDALTQEIEAREQALVREFSALVEIASRPGGTNSAGFRTGLNRFSSQRDIDRVIVDRCRAKLSEAHDVGALGRRTLTWALDGLMDRIAPRT